MLSKVPGALYPPDKLLQNLPAARDDCVHHPP